MRHGIKTRKFGRKKDERNALMGSQVRSLILKEKIKTTEAKAKSLRPVVEKIITTAKKNSLPARRNLIEKVGAEAGKKLIDVIGPKYMDRNGGYARIIKMPQRKSDGSPMAIIELV